MSKKSEQAAKLLEKVELPGGVPTPMQEGSLLEQGLYVVLLRHLPAARAEAAVQALPKAYPDWNEVRVSQAQEVAVHLAPKSAQKTPDKLRKYVPAARAAKEYLQEVFQKTHGLDLLELRDDAQAAGKLVSQMPYLGGVGGAFLLWLAGDRQLPVTQGLIRVLDRLGLMTRTQSPKKARAAIEPLVPKGDELRFATTLGHVAEQWCVQRSPICWECPLRDDCPTGKKVVKDWKVQQERLEAQRAKEEARRAAQEKRERERHERERRKAAEADRRRLEKEARAAERKKAAAEKKAAADKKKAAAKKAPAKKAPAKKPTTNKKPATAAKKTAKATTKKGKTAKKPAPKKKTTASRKAPRKKTARRR